MRKCHYDIYPLASGSSSASGTNTMPPSPPPLISIRDALGKILFSLKSQFGDCDSFDRLPSGSCWIDSENYPRGSRWQRFESPNRWFPAEFRRSYQRAASKCEIFLERSVGLPVHHGEGTRGPLRDCESNDRKICPETRGVRGPTGQTSSAV